MKAPPILRQSTVKITAKDGAICSGVIVSPKKIVTARHCVTSSADGASYLISFGVDARTIKYNVRGVGKVSSAGAHDMALIMVNEIPAGYQPAPMMNSSDRLNPQQEVLFAGWGGTASSRRDAGKYLRWGRSYLSKFESEVKTSDGESTRSLLTFTNMNSTVPCGGDSGGPVFAQSGKGWELTGIISSSVCTADTSGLFHAADPRPYADKLSQ